MCAVNSAPLLHRPGWNSSQHFQKTRSGKIMRRYLKAKEMGAEVGDISTLDQ
jgi:acyl-coenzyme A synthetase/AMP-(fatty) acid ligase